MSLVNDLLQNLQHHTVIDHHPFTHAVCTPFWPEDFYQRLLEHFPLDHAFVVRGSRIAEDGGYGGGRTRMCQRLWDWPVWDEAVKALESETFMTALQKTIGVEPLSGLVSRCLLHKDVSGYSISPHTDIKSKYISYVVYFAKDMNHKHLGTILLKPQPWITPEHKNEHCHWYDFTPQKMIGYLPNSLSFWRTSDYSYHAVDVRFDTTDPIQERISIRGFGFDLSRGALPYVFQEDIRERMAAN